MTPLPSWSGPVHLIREGNRPAQNLDALMALLCDKYSERCMVRSDDKHPSDLLEKGPYRHTW
jgi:adenine deaminase